MRYIICRTESFKDCYEKFVDAILTLRGNTAGTKMATKMINIARIFTAHNSIVPSEDPRNLEMRKHPGVSDESTAASEMLCGVVVNTYVLYMHTDGIDESIFGGAVVIDILRVWCSLFSDQYIITRIVYIFKAFHRLL